MGIENEKEKLEERIYFTYDEQDVKTAHIESDADSDVVEEESRPKKTSRKKKIKIFIFSAIGLVALAILTFFVVRERDKREKEKNTIFLTEDFFYVNFFGYDGFGECYASLNYELFMESAKDIFGEKADEVFSTIYVGVDYPYNLSNGDKVKVRVDIDKEAIEGFDVHIENVEFTFEVTGLSPMTEFDPFIYIEVLKIEYGGREAYTVEYPEGAPFVLSREDFEITSSYIDGETLICVNVKEDVLERLTDLGVIFNNISKTFNADEVKNKIVSDYDDISEMLEEDLHSEALREITEVYNQYGNEIILDSISYYGGWIETYENMSSLDKLIQVYEINIHHAGNLFEPQKLYLKYECSDIVVGLDRNGYIIKEWGIGVNPTQTFTTGSYEYGFRGYTSINELLFREVVSSVRRYITFDSNGNIDSFFTDEVIYK